MRLRTPKVECFLMPDLIGDFFWLVVPNCPYCHAKHKHLGGIRGSDPAIWVGRKNAVCDLKKQYDIFWKKKYYEGKL